VSFRRVCAQPDLPISARSKLFVLARTTRSAQCADASGSRVTERCISS